MWVVLTNSIFTQIIILQLKSKDDLHVTTKHAQIYPNEQELTAVQTAVQQVEAALKEVSKKIHEQEMLVFTAANMQ